MASRRIPTSEYASIQAVIRTDLPEATYIRGIIQEFIDDPLLVTSGKSVVSRKVYDYAKNPSTPKEIEYPLKRIQDYLFKWSEFLFKEHLIDSPIWLQEDTEYNFGLNDEKPILKFSDLMRLFQKALVTSQTMIGLSNRKNVSSEDQVAEATIEDSDYDKNVSLNIRVPSLGSTGGGGKKSKDTSPRKQETKSSEQPSISEKAQRLVSMSSSIRRERLRIQESVISAIAAETGIDREFVHSMLSEDISKVTGVIFNSLDPNDLQDTMLNVTKKMNIYRDILRNTEIISRTQVLINEFQKKQPVLKRKEATEKIASKKPEDVLVAIQKEEENVTADASYQNAVKNMSSSFSMDIDQFEQVLKDTLRNNGNGLSEIEILNIVARTKAYALSRKNINTVGSSDIENFLLPILGESGFQKVYTLVGGEENIAEIIEVLIEKTQIDWKNRTQRSAILFSDPNLPQELTSEILFLHKTYGERVVGYSLLLSPRDLSTKRKYIETLMDQETDGQKLSIFQQELRALAEAQDLQTSLLQNVETYQDNPFVRKTYTQAIHVELSRDWKLLKSEYDEITDDSVFLIQKFDYDDTTQIPWEEVSNVPYRVTTYYLYDYPVQQEASQDSLRYRLASTSEQRFSQTMHGLQRYQKVLQLAKKTKTLVETAKKIRILQAVITFVLNFWLAILALLAAIALVAAVISIVNQIATYFSSGVTSEAAKDIATSTTTNVSKSIKSFGSGGGKSLFSPTYSARVAPSLPLSLSTFFSHVAAATPGTVAAAGAITSVAVGSAYMVYVQTSSFLTDRGNIPDVLESKYVSVKKGAGPAIENDFKFDNVATHHLKNEVVWDSKPIKYTITIEPTASVSGTTVALKNISFTDTMKITSRGPNYNDLVSPPVYDVVVYQGNDLDFSDKDPNFENGIKYPVGDSDISIAPGSTYKIVYTLNTKPEYDDSLIVNTVRVSVTAEITQKDGTITTTTEETGKTLTLRVGNPPALPSVQYAKSLAQAIYDNDPDIKEDVKISDFPAGLSDGLENDGFGNVLGTLRGSAEQFGKLQCVGFAVALEEGMGFTLPIGFGTAQGYRNIRPESGYTFHEGTSDGFPEPGDYVIMAGGTAGHIGMFSEVTAPSDPNAPFFYRIIDANWNLKGGVRGSNEIPESEVYSSDITIAGFLNYAGFLRRN